jgi:hypothetical protein
MCLAYVTQALDKGTLGPASIMGWQTNVGAKGQDFALTSTFLWCGIIAGEPIVRASPSTHADQIRRLMLMGPGKPIRSTTSSRQTPRRIHPGLVFRM